VEGESKGIRLGCVQKKGGEAASARLVSKERESLCSVDIARKGPEKAHSCATAKTSPVVHEKPATKV
jgi:hypothetical protein